MPLPPPCEGRLTADKKGPIPLPDDDDSKLDFFIVFLFYFLISYCVIHRL